MSQCHITCALHDYIEIACMYGYQVKLRLKNGQIISGKALDIQTSVDKREYLIIDNEPQ
ncbi:MAG: Rho-binding antiterminator, partial [Methyloprofundus sp.]|nr:Rho-binding antiterminator [Methyloprofundus sp.]